MYYHRVNHGRGSCQTYRRPRVSEKNVTNWMEQLSNQYPKFRNLPLNKVAMPGSHDAGMGDRVIPTPAPDFWPNLYLWSEYQVAQAAMPIYKDWAIAQDYTIGRQLEEGSRYLDLRVAPMVVNTDGHYTVCEDRLYTVHGLYGQSIKSILGQLRDFLTVNKKEIVVLDFQHLWEMTPNAYRVLNDLIFQYVGDWLIPTTYSVTNPISKFQDNNKRVLAIIGEDHQRRTDEIDPFKYLTPGYFWPRSSILTSNWFNTTNINTLGIKLNEEVIKMQNEDGLWVLQAVLTPDVMSYIKGFAKPEQSSLKEMEKDVPRMIKELVPMWTNQGWAINILMYDFVNSSTSDAIISNNLPRIM